MNSIVDIDEILSENEQWRKLEEEWGIPVDLEGDADDDQPVLHRVFSTIDLKTTFDSSFLFKKVRRNLGRQLSKKSASSALEYRDFISNLQNDPMRESSQQFYCVNGQIVSAVSVDEICKKIDDIFKSIEKLSSCSTVRKKVKTLPEIVQCSISATDLSFDDTEYEYNSEIDRHMEEAFQELSSTINSIDRVDMSTLESVTTLVRKFSSILNHPNMKCNPRHQRQCSEKFKDLAEFWKSRAFANEASNKNCNEPNR
ncbi:uncharacterized protein LOC119834816 [Zerene cesonia]|uniref:uncharacterized protein LOC119834816 n=1 Tax=Zerene cesonia TaxID=33412 RepID=UPI0018E503FE|nr:uncharacterized protein LOC119834816 [Zerene cesonia]